MSSYVIQGDTFTTIAAKFGTASEALQQANPGVDHTSLPVGYEIKLPAQLGHEIYIVKDGDTLDAIAEKFHTTSDNIQELNPLIRDKNYIKPGWILRIPFPNTPFPTQSSLGLHATGGSGGHYTVKLHDTWYSIAFDHQVTIISLHDANPGVKVLKPGEEIQIPERDHYIVQSGDYLWLIADGFKTPGHDNVEEVIQEFIKANPSVIDPKHLDRIYPGQDFTLPPDADPRGGPHKTYVRFCGPASNYPDPAKWVTYDELWKRSKTMMENAGKNTPSQIGFINQAIGKVSKDTGMDARVILCIIIQESGGNVKVEDTWNPIRNSGIMQAHDGASWKSWGNPETYKQQRDCIFQMVRDGADHTVSGDGLKAIYEKNDPVKGGSQNYYISL
ncbi:hypothetical protein L207DRAFT_594251 [Hyaloscypha variabilis F]|uniref:LysM domain-containing protein n=1 Tax=Hyaloscypha variabilis (strain UAMH 11265 / GT02V1 / F) TaxID=1149755 RepID=A0A2J6SBE8_HYAVF|nr:hypothetical protein L207DRAFT_594251 [Hyaloscypha variabilis F]